MTFLSGNESDVGYGIFVDITSNSYITITFKKIIEGRKEYVNMPVVDEVLRKLERYEFGKDVQQWIEKFKETPYVKEILSFMIRKHFNSKDEERWITPYKLLKEAKIRGKDGFYSRSIPNLIELGVLDFKETKTTPYSQTHRYVKLNDNFINEVI